MKHLKLFEAHKETLENIKKDIIKKIMDLIKRWNLPYFYVGIEDDDSDYGYDTIELKDGKWIFNYNYYYAKGKSTPYQKELSDVPATILMEVDDLCEKYDRYKPEYSLELMADNCNIDVFINILKDVKEPIDFSTWMFAAFGESGEYDDTINTKKFQDILFKTHPESITTFIEAIKDSNGEIKLLDKKYKHLVNASKIDLM